MLDEALSRGYAAGARTARTLAARDLGLIEGIEPSVLTFTTDRPELGGRGPTLPTIS